MTKEIDGERADRVTERVRPTSADGGSDNGSYWLDLGDVAIVPLVENPRLLIDIGEFFPQQCQPDTSWCYESPWFDHAENKLVYTIQAFLVVTPKSVILVDGCVGSRKARNRPDFNDLDDSWRQQFAATGFDIEDVSSVIISHLHVDHVGWLTERTENGWSPLFENAQHFVSRLEVDYWTSDAGRTAMSRTGNYYQDSVQPVFNRQLMSYFEEGVEIDERVKIIAAPGHTPGNVCIRVTGAAGSVLLGGDLVHHPLQMASPEHSTRYCIDPKQAAMTRREFLLRLAQTGDILQTSHFAGVSAGRVHRAGSGFGLRLATDIINKGPYRVSNPPSTISDGAQM